MIGNLYRIVVFQMVVCIGLDLNTKVVFFFFHLRRQSNGFKLNNVEEVVRKVNKQKSLHF